MSEGRSEQLIADHGVFGVSGLTGAGSARHAVDRRSGKTLCGRDPLTIFGVDLKSRRQVTCGRCYRLAFASVNAYAKSVPDTPIPVPAKEDDMTESFTITSRYLVKEQGWKTDVVEHRGTMQDAWREASRFAQALDDTHGDDHFWTVTLGGGKHGAAGDIAQLFHGRTI